MRETRKARQRGSWPSESRRAYRSYVPPSGAKSSRAYAGRVALADDLERIAVAAADFAASNERISGIVAASPIAGAVVYLCAYESADGHSWLAFDESAAPVEDRRLVHDAASLAALCEAVEDLAGVEPPQPRLATHAYLDALGAGIGAGLAAAVESVLPAVEELAAQVEAQYKVPLA